MKFPFRLSVSLLTAFLCVVPCFGGAAWSAVPSPPGEVSEAIPSIQAGTQAPSSSADVTIPGPLRPFLRMSGISQNVTPEEVLPFLARNAVVQGFEYGKPTEFLILLRRYLEQARELVQLAGPEGVIRVSNCNDAKPLLAILGYRLRQGCGPKTSAEAAVPDRAFLTIDSGFPLADLEEALRGGKPFLHPFPSTLVPALFTQDDWLAINKNEKHPRESLVDSLLHNPALARLYWALARIDTETRADLRQSPGLQNLIPFAGVLDFYGSYICIRSGRVVVPGGSPAESAWKELVGADPASPGEFVGRLVAKDEGWLAAYFDALSRVNQEQQAYFTEPRRLQRFYKALRGRDVTPGAARPVFRPNPGLVLLVTRLQVDLNGQPYVPGNLEVWKKFLRREGDSKKVKDWAKRASHWNNSEQLVEGMFELSRLTSKDGPLQIYLSLSEIDRGRPREQRLSPQTVRLLGGKFSRFGNQYSIFSEFHGLNDASITRFLTVAQALDRIPERMERADALGILQANIGLWQILARQGQISDANLNDSWQRVINPFAAIVSPAQVFDAGRASLGAQLRAATGKPALSQEGIIELLAGPGQTDPEGQKVRRDLADKIRSVMSDQRLVSLDTLFALGDGLNQLAQDRNSADTLVQLAGELREFEMPRPLLTARERTEWASGPSHNRHTAIEMQTDLSKIIKSPGSANDLAKARGQLAPFLRDTLVGLNYAYYEPPGGQMLHNNALFVRSHDFSGEMTIGGEQAWQTPQLFDRGSTANGGAFLAGSLADLPYVLAQVEQDFIVPENVQSLIWEDMVPGLLTSAVVPRWWGVTRNELHAVTLYQRTGEELLAAARENEKLRLAVLKILSDRMLPQRFEQIELALNSGHPQDLLPQMTPADTFYLAAEYRRRFPGNNDYWGPAGKEMESLSLSNPAEVSWDRLSADFGVPHPILAQSYARELLNMKPFPTYMGYSSRLLAESWDSNNLYWARLADEMGYPPVMLNQLVPELTHYMAGRIFGSHLEDSPALLRAMKETGDDFRQGKIASLPKSGTAPGH
jgi:hypothetical protein